MDPTLDTSKLQHTAPTFGLLQQWTLHLGLLDAWPSTYPTKKEFTGPKRRNRIDYCFLYTALFTNNLVKIKHNFEDQYHHADHLPIMFQLKHADYPSYTRLP
uniref:AlNc14C526G12049 protein n=1 Tax=Albugo laibachii Nc14 TaxID=890382 RepID=F0X0V9_9STRA|nr:AlNc14C526G12049 [Albugo laibachii Nc14]|eukprot:CCA27404.1 AlNc14C526G12049 [Albugo laibachii Nc14]